MSKKYYEYYEQIYAAVLASGGDCFNFPPDGNFDELFKRSFLPVDGRVLDLGCGEGFYTLLFASEGYPVLGIDISASAIALANQRAAAQNRTDVQFRVGDVTHLAGLSDQSFDTVLSIHCFHCLSDARDRSAHLQESWRVLRPGGIFVFDNMAAPLEEDMPSFRTWHVQQGGEISEDASGVTTSMQASQPFHCRVKPSQTVIDVPTGIALAHRFYGRLPHIIAQIESLGFEVLSAETTVPDRATLRRPELVHGDNVLYATKPLQGKNPQPETLPAGSTAESAHRYPRRQFFPDATIH